MVGVTVNRQLCSSVGIVVAGLAPAMLPCSSAVVSLCLEVYNAGKLIDGRGHEITSKRQVIWLRSKGSTESKGVNQNGKKSRAIQAEEKGNLQFVAHRQKEVVRFKQVS